MEEIQSERNENVGSSTTMKKTLLGLVIVLLLAASWVGAQQFAQSAVISANFTAPYFTTWFGTSWMLLCFPIYCIFIVIFSKNDFKQSVRQSCCIFGPQKFQLSEIFIKVLPFNILWIVVNYLYIFSLTNIAATDASAILSSNVAFVYALSFIFLGELFYVIRVCASLFCISGIVLFAYADGFAGGNDLLKGIIMALCSAFGSALYQVLFKKVIGEGTLGQVTLFLTLLGFTNTIFLWIPFLPLYFTGVEEIVFSNIPWMFVCISSLLSLIFNFLVNFGVAYTFPLFIAIAMMLGIPINAAVDVIARNESFSAIRLVATFLVVCGFSLMLFPDSWNLFLNKQLGLVSPRCYRHEDLQNDLSAKSGKIKNDESSDMNTDQVASLIENIDKV